MGKQCFLHEPLDDLVADDPRDRRALRTELLGGLIKQKFSPELWDVRNRLTQRAIDEESR